MEQVTGLHRQSLVGRLRGPRLAPAWPTPDTASPPAPAGTDVWRATAPRHRTASPHRVTERLRLPRKGPERANHAPRDVPDVLMS